MRILHTADLHLGHFRYSRLAPGGSINQREADVARSFVALIDAAVALRPDVVLVAGDIFDKANPSNRTIVLASEQFQRLKDAGIPCVAVAGNHDQKNATQGVILPALRQAGVQVAWQGPERFSFPALGLSILAVPESHCKTTDFTPDPDARYNALLLHAAMQGTVPGDEHLSVEALHAERFSFCALGDFHEMTEIAPNAFYSGAIERTTTDVWAEARSEVPKGFIVADLAAGTHEFIPLPDLRPHYDLPRIYAHGMSPAGVDAAIAANVAAAALEDAVVRQVVADISVDVSRALDHRALRKYRAAAVAFNLDCRRPEIIRVFSGGPVVTTDDDEYYHDGEIAPGRDEPASQFDCPLPFDLEEMLSYNGPAVRNEALIRAFASMPDPYEIAPEVAREDAA